MKKLAVALAAVAAFALAAPGLAETWTHVTLVDTNCSKKVAADPDAHTRDCAIQCAQSGYGILTAEGSFLKFDAEGSKRALEVLRAAERADHLRVDVTGTLEEGVLRLESIRMSE